MAIVAVMIYHLEWSLPEQLEPVANLGWMGVELFFVLSGYLIGSQLLKPHARGETPDLWEFYRRRAYRILPAYLFVVLLYFAVPVWREAEGISPVWQFLTFTENLFVDFPAHRAFSHAWSLCVEEHFYLVLPLLVLWRMKRPSAWKTVALIGSFVLFGIGSRWFELMHAVRVSGLSDQQVGSMFMERIYYPTYSRLDGLLIGVTLAVIRIFRPTWWAAVTQRGNTLLALGVCLTAAAIWIFKGDYPSPDDTFAILFGFPILSLGLGFVVASATCAKGLLNTRIPGAQLLATLAFSLYLTHKEIAHLDRLYLPWMNDNRGWLVAVIYAVSCIAAANLLYGCIELPFLRLRDRRAKVTTEEIVLAESAL